MRIPGSREQKSRPRPPAPPSAPAKGSIFDPHPFGRLTEKKASSASGFNFQLTNDNEDLTDPDFRVSSQAKSATIELPEGVTLNPSVGAGLGICTPSQFAAERATSLQGEGCPNSAKIGDFTVHTPLFEETLQGRSTSPPPTTTPTAPCWRSTWSQGRRFAG